MTSLTRKATEAAASLPSIVMRFSLAKCHLPFPALAAYELQAPTPAKQAIRDRTLSARLASITDTLNCSPRSALWLLSFHRAPGLVRVEAVDLLRNFERIRSEILLIDDA